MLITDYTTYADIRAALGVSDDEIEDATLALALYANLLQSDLEDIDLTLPDTYTTTKVIVSPTAEESRFLQAAEVFATFSVAKQLSSSLPLFAAKQMTDSKAGMTRFDNPYKDVIAGITREYDRARTRLMQALAAIGTTTTDATPRTYMARIAPAFDPITGV